VGIEVGSAAKLCAGSRFEWAVERPIDDLPRQRGQGHAFLLRVARAFAYAGPSMTRTNEGAGQ
jgi:hypothetical protein